MTKTVSARAPEDVLERMADEYERRVHRGDMPVTAMSAALSASGLVEALETYREFDRRIQDSLGEAVHTGLRKGVDGKGSAQAWHAISAMTGNGWSEAVNFARDGLEYGIEDRLEQARALLSPKERG